MLLADDVSVQRGIIRIDAQRGDTGRPSAQIAIGATKSLLASGDKVPSIILYGEVNKLIALVSESDLAGKVEVRPLSKSITDLRDEGGCLVTAGGFNTVLPLAMNRLGCIDGIARPTAVSPMPVFAPDGSPHTYLATDMGANSDLIDGRTLVLNAVMAAELAKVQLGRRSPKVGFLCNGVESRRGRVHERDAMKYIAGHPERFAFSLVKNGSDETAFIEPGQEALVDVLVTDGFTGNVHLKTRETTAKQCGYIFKSALTSTWKGKLAAWFIRNELSKVRRAIDPELYDGATVLGLEKPLVRSHGASTAVGFTSSVMLAKQVVALDLAGRIKKAVAAAQIDV